MNIERLRLVDEGASVSSHFHKSALSQFPHCLIERLELIGNVEPLQMVRAQMMIPLNSAARGKSGSKMQIESSSSCHYLDTSIGGYQLILGVCTPEAQSSEV